MRNFSFSHSIAEGNPQEKQCKEKTIEAKSKPKRKEILAPKRYDFDFEFYRYLVKM